MRERVSERERERERERGERERERALSEVGEIIEVRSYAFTICIGFGPCANGVRMIDYRHFNIREQCVQ